MPHVDILITNTEPGDPVQLDGGKVEVVNGVAVYDGPRPDIADTMRSGVRIGKRVWYPEDGHKFLKLMPVLFNGSYVRARYVP